jgi:hypothetical protein
VAVRLPVAPRALVVAAAIPLLFLHSKFQPSVSVDLGGTSVDAYLSDFAILAVVATAVAVVLRQGAGRLRSAGALWLLLLAFFGWVAFELAWGAHLTGSYPTATHAVTALKFAEYALLAPAVAVIVRRRDDLLAVLWSFTAWSACATVVGLAEFFGSSFASKGAVGHRQASFLSHSDFAALSSATLLAGVLALALPRLQLPRALALVALGSGVLGTVVAGAMASALGVVTALAAVGLLARRELAFRRALAALAATAVAVLGVVAIRGHDLSAFAKFLGAQPTQEQREAHVQTYAHHTLLVWLGYRIWRDRPLLGAGWEGSSEPEVFMPYLDEAHARFPNEAPLAFPGPQPDRRYGVQNIWVQALADLGVVGLLLWVGVFAAAAWRAIRHGAHLALAWIALALWLWSAQGFVAGIPLEALTWIAVGLAAVRLDAE